MGGAVDENADLVWFGGVVQVPDNVVPNRAVVRAAGELDARAGIVVDDVAVIEDRADGVVRRIDEDARTAVAKAIPANGIFIDFIELSGRDVNAGSAVALNRVAIKSACADKRMGGFDVNALSFALPRSRVLSMSPIVLPEIELLVAEAPLMKMPYPPLAEMSFPSLLPMLSFPLSTM